MNTRVRVVKGHYVLRCSRCRRKIRDKDIHSYDDWWYGVRIDDWTCWYCGFNDSTG